MRRGQRRGERKSSPHNNRTLALPHTRPLRVAKVSQRNAKSSQRLLHGGGHGFHTANMTMRQRRQPQALNASLLPPLSGPPPQPCPKSNLAARIRQKAASRQLKCAQPGVREASLDEPIPLVWSRELVGSRRVFRNENPFETRKFTPFLHQLPASSNISQVLQGTASLRCSACDTCAVVGASGSLLARRHGALIDAHEVVLRPNWLLTQGYESLVGTRTDLNLFFGVEGMIDQFDSAQRKLPIGQRAIGLVTPASDRSVASFFRHMSRVHKNRTRSCRSSCSVRASPAAALPHGARAL